METIRFIKEKGLKALNEDLTITVKEYADRIVLDYLAPLSPKYHPVVKECRGLILSKDLRVLCRSFDKFYNFGEDLYSNNFNIVQALCYDKLDGTLINVYHDGKKWCCSTRGTAFAEGNLPFPLPGVPSSFNELFEMAIKNRVEELYLGFPEDLVFIHELTSPYNRIVTPYQNTQAYLLTVRDRETGLELSVSDVDSIAVNLGVLRPKIYRFSSINEILEAARSLPNLEEGYVCNISRWQTGKTFKNLNVEGWLADSWRIKIKNPQYLAWCRIRNGGNISKKNILSMVWQGSESDYLGIFPEDMLYFKPYIEGRERMLQTIQDYREVIQETSDRKEFAARIKDLPSFFAVILFYLHRGTPLSEIFERSLESSREKLLDYFSGVE